MRKQIKLELKSVDDAGFEGFASVFGVKDLGNDVVVKGAFAESIAREKGLFPLFYAHRMNVGVARCSETETGLATAGKFNMAKQSAVDVHSDVKFYHGNGLTFGMSIGYDYDPADIKLKDGVAYLHKLDLYEVTLTEFPMNLAARVTNVKALLAKADFLTELDSAETWAKRYFLMDALDMSLYTIIWSESSPEEKVAAAAESIDQFTTAYLEHLPKLLALMDSRFKSQVDEFEKKSGRAIAATYKASALAALKDLRAQLTASEAAPETDARISSLLSDLKGVLDGKVS